MRLFFYGTLMAGSGNPLARLVERRLRCLGPAETGGALHAVPDPLGWYPALIAGGGSVRGMLYEAGAAFTAEDLARLDAFEDFDPARPGESLYRREPVAVAVPHGAATTAQAYVFNQPLPPGSLAVADGDFRAWLARGGLAPYRE